MVSDAKGDLNRFESGLQCQPAYTLGEGIFARLDFKILIQEVALLKYSLCRKLYIG
jgi:hypothetical protein